LAAVTVAAPGRIGASLLGAQQQRGVSSISQ
jgi:hypothetical protein